MNWRWKAFWHGFFFWRRPCSNYALDEVERLEKELKDAKEIKDLVINVLGKQEVRHELAIKRLKGLMDYRFPDNLGWDGVSDCVELLKKTQEENKRLKRGDFTPEEFQNICHNLDEEKQKNFCDGCDEYQRKLFGTCRSDELEAENKRLKEELEKAKDKMIDPDSYVKMHPKKVRSIEDAN